VTIIIIIIIIIIIKIFFVMRSVRYSEKGESMFGLGKYWGKMIRSRGLMG